MKKLLFIAVAMVALCAFTLPAMAQEKADWAFYGQMRMWTAWEKASDETAISGFTGGSTARGWENTFTGQIEDDDQLEWKAQTNARIGASVKWGAIGGRVEFGNNGAPKGGDFGTTYRLLYGTWNFGAGTFEVGKDYTPYFFIVSGLCGPGGGECNGIGYGTIYHGRRAQLKLIIGGFQVALVEPANSSLIDVNTGLPFAGIGGGFDTDQTVPTIEASYAFNVGPVGLFVGGLYNTFKNQYGTPTGVTDVDINSWAVGAGARMAFGPLYFNVTGQYGRNVGNLGMPTNLPTVLTTELYDPLTDDTEDATYWAGQGIVGFKLTDAFSLEGGAVYQQGKQSFLDVDLKNSQWVYYLQAVYSPAKNIFIVPEIGYIDGGDFEETGFEDEDEGNIKWVGIKWQINF